VQEVLCAGMGLFGADDQGSCGNLRYEAAAVAFLE
jgi:hypothetical protein